MSDQNARLLILSMIGLMLILPLVPAGSETLSDRQTNTQADESTSPAGASAEDSGVRSRAPGGLAAPGVMQQQLKPIPRPADAIIHAGPAPANVTLTAVTPTNIMIQWSPSPGAIRYLISRNGAPDIPIDANAGFLQGNRFIYTDVGRKPATLHTYSVTAQFPAPTLPGRSAPVQLLTPSALPPRNFKATATPVSPNLSWDVTLSWAPTAEATGYRLIRNGGNLPATVLNATGISYVDHSLSPGDYTYIIYSVIRLPNGEELHGEFSKPVSVKARPFTVVAIGDSIMWGQGLQDGDKFATKVTNWAAGQLGKPARVKIIAHSGATINAPDAGPPSRESDPNQLPSSQEIPSTFPTISYQVRVLAPAVFPPNEVDLVLVDGCANDVDISTVILPADSTGDLQTKTGVLCNGPVQALLSQVARTFPTSKVATIGYYPPISLMSNLGVLVPTWVAAGLVTTVVTGGATLPLIPPDPIVGGIVAGIYQVYSTDRSNVFFTESTNGIRSAVTLVNSTQEGNNRFRFVEIPVGPDNSYGAINSWLWLIPAPPGVKDEVYDVRSRACDTNPAFGGIKCKQASMGHPNVAGAQAYADAIAATLTQFVPEWRAAHAASALALEDPLVVKVQPVASEPSGGTIIVTASDGPSGPQLQGTVQLNGVAAGVLGSQIRYSYRQSNPTDIQVIVNVPNRVTHSFTIPVRAQTPAVNVTNTGDPRTAIVTAMDSTTGQQLSGTVIVYAKPNQVSGATGQPLTYPSCGQIDQAQRFSRVALNSGPAPCTGAVHVPFYRDASFQDVPGSINLAIQVPANLPTKSGGP